MKAEMMGKVHLSHIPAHKVIATVAPFRAWRGSQLFIARGPRWTPHYMPNCLANASNVNMRDFDSLLAIANTACPTQVAQHDS